MNSQLNRPHTIAEYQAMFATIYPQPNNVNNDYHLILKLIQEICVCMELARKDEWEELPTRLSRIYRRINAVATICGIDLQEALWDKYPNVCPYCLRDHDCICAIEHPDVTDKDLKLRRLRRDVANMPVTLSAHQALHKKLYARQNRRILLIQIAAHMAEEAGEVIDEFYNKNKSGLQDEISDVISWIFALANRCGFELADAVWELYSYECESCHATPCINDNKCGNAPVESAQVIGAGG